MIGRTAEVIKDLVQMAAIAGGLCWAIDSMKPTCIEKMNFQGNEVRVYQAKNMIPGGQMYRGEDNKTEIKYADGTTASYSCRLTPAQIASELKGSEHSRRGN